MSHDPAQRRTIRPREDDARYELFACYLFMSPSYWHAHQHATKGVGRAVLEEHLPHYFPEVQRTYEALGSVFHVEFDEWWAKAREHFGFGDGAGVPTFELTHSTIEIAALWWRLTFLRAVGGKRTVNRHGEPIEHQTRLTHARIWEWQYQSVSGRNVPKDTLKPYKPDPDYYETNPHWRSEKPRRRDVADRHVRDVSERAARKALHSAFLTSEWAARGRFPMNKEIKFERFNDYLLTPALHGRIRAQSAQDLELQREAFRAAHPGAPVRLDQWLAIEGFNREEARRQADGFTKEEAIQWLKDFAGNRKAMRIAPNKAILQHIQERAKRERW